MSDERVTKRMGQLLRKGAALLDVACPKCNTPLLRLKDGKMYCVKCDLEVVEQQRVTPNHVPQTASNEILNTLASKILMTLQTLTQSLPEQPHPEEIRSFATVVRDLIEILRGIRELLT